MRQYGFNKATEFSKKQIGVIFAKAKSGNLKVERWVMQDFYDMADYYGLDSNGNVEYAEGKIKQILDAVFAGDMALAQQLIDAYTENTFGRLSIKNQKSVDRTII